MGGCDLSTMIRVAQIRHGICLFKERLITLLESNFFSWASLEECDIVYIQAENTCGNSCSLRYLLLETFLNFCIFQLFTICLNFSQFSTTYINLSQLLSFFLQMIFSVFLKKSHSQFTRSSFTNIICILFDLWQIPCLWLSASWVHLSWYFE